MSLANSAREIRGRMDTHIHHAESISIDLGQRFGRQELQETGVPALKLALTTTRRKANDITEEAEGVETRIARLEDRFESKMTEIQRNLSETQCELWQMKEALHTGQTAYNFEKDLATYIYPPGTSITHGRIFSTLMDWLRENRETPQGRESNGKWEEFKNQFRWSRTHENVFFKMLRCRQTFAHPEVDFTFPIPKNFTRTEERHAEDIRDMAIWLNEQQKPGVNNTT